MRREDGKTLYTYVCNSNLPLGEDIMDSRLRAVLYGDPGKSPSTWSNGKASVRYHSDGDYWSWKTPAGKGYSFMFEDVLTAVKPYL